jgi:hypothetical protein
MPPIVESHVEEAKALFTTRQDVNMIVAADMSVLIFLLPESIIVPP